MYRRGQPPEPQGCPERAGDGAGHNCRQLTERAELVKWLGASVSVGGSAAADAVVLSVSSSPVLAARPRQNLVHLHSAGPEKVRFFHLFFARS